VEKASFRKTGKSPGQIVYVSAQSTEFLKDYIEIGERDRVEKFLDYFERRAMPPEEEARSREARRKVASDG
jgi:hypothetical protein